VRVAKGGAREREELHIAGTLGRSKVQLREGIERRKTSRDSIAVWAGRSLGRERGQEVGNKSKEMERRGHLPREGDWSPQPNELEGPGERNEDCGISPVRGNGKP